MTRPPAPLDRSAILRAFHGAAAGFDQAAVLHRETARRMAERLEYIRFEPKRIADLGCGTGADLNLLGERYPKAQRLALDFALPMLRQATQRGAWFQRILPRLTGARPQPVCADVEQLPFKAGSLDLAWSNLMLHWLADPLPAFKEIQRSLAVDGLFMFTTLGPDTLKELSQAFAAAHADHTPHVHRFIDMHDLGDMLVTAGFAEPVMDMEVLTLTYATLDELFADLKNSGSHNAALGRQRGLLGKQTWHRVIAAYESLRRDGRLPATFEVVYGHAWKAKAKTTDDGRSIVQFDPKARGRG